MSLFLPYGMNAELNRRDSPFGAAIADVAKALQELDRDLFVVVEQDMYPTDFDKPKPIAQRTYTYLRGVGIGRE